MNKNEFDDIKRTLQRIQRIASEPIDETGLSDPPAEDTAAALNEDATTGGNSDQARQFAQRARLRLAVVAIAAGVIGTVGLASWWVLVRSDVEPARTVEATSALGTTEPQQPPTDQFKGDASLVTTQAESLLDTGHVNEARRSLIDLPAKSPEAALALARSYDPNYLRLIPNADAAADPAEAERWYRAWRDIAIEHGLVLEPDRFDRIIKAMR
jgi:hypothetical protein